jgi:hypothetical protein
MVGELREFVEQASASRRGPPHSRANGRGVAVTDGWSFRAIRGRRRWLVERTTFSVAHQRWGGDPLAIAVKEAAQA